MAISFRPEDRIFVQLAIDECRKLNLPKHAPTALIWNSRLPDDQPFLHQSHLMMPEALNDKITPQEARPLIMSAILQKERVKRRNPPDRYSALLVTLGMTCIIGVPIAIIAIYGTRPSSTTDDVVAGFFWGGIALLLVGSSFENLRYNRVQRLECDLQVARLIGTDIFLQTLRKIEGLNSTTKPGRVRLLTSRWPSLFQRIANLENPSLPITEKDALEAFQRQLRATSKAQTSDSKSKDHHGNDNSPT